MAFKCPSCGKELIPNPKDSSYLLCTNCNKNFKIPGNNTSESSEKKKSKKKKGGGILKIIVIVLVIFVLIGIVGSLFAPEDNTQKADSSSNSETEKEEAKKDAAFNVGETAEYNNVQVTVIGYEESAGNEWVQPEEGKIFVLPEIEISNNSDEEVSVSSMISFDCYVGDYKADFSSNAFMSISMEGGKQQLDGSIAPGKKLRGFLGIEAPTDWSTIEIYYKDNVWLSSNFSFLITK